MESRFEVGRVDEIPEGRGQVFRVGEQSIAVFKDGGRLFAIGDRCPHAGASLGSGWIEDGAVVCPLHRWRFRLKDGRCLSGDAETIARFAVEVLDGSAWVIS